MAYTGVERRQFPRTNHTYTISFKIYNEPEANWGISNTRNLSLGGALFLSSESFLPETLLEIRLKIPTQSANCQCRARIQRCGGPLKNAFYKTTIYFTEIDTRYIEPLRESINFFLGKEKRT